MLIFKTKWFNKWALKEGVSDKALAKSVSEMNQGLIDANLGGNVYKKRIGLQKRGKRGSVRALKAYARELLGFSKIALEKAIKTKILIKVYGNES